MYAPTQTYVMIPLLFQQPNTATFNSSLWRHNGTGPPLECYPGFGVPDTAARRFRYGQPWRAGRLAFFDPGAILGDAILFAKRGKHSDDKARAAVASSGPG